jgi:hypothetical protein
MIMAATIATSPALAVTSRKALFPAAAIVTANPHANYDVSPDGKWFAFARRGGANHIVVLQNVAELARRLARGGSSTP